MTSVTEIKQAILELPEANYAELRRWFSELDWEKWDREIEEDAAAGRLDFLRMEALEAKANGTLGYL
jgi:hypothetical protein